MPTGLRTLPVVTEKARVIRRISAEIFIRFESVIAKSVPIIATVSFMRNAERKPAAAVKRRKKRFSVRGFAKNLSIYGFNAPLSESALPTMNAPARKTITS